MPRDFTCGLDDLPNAEAAAIAQVVDEFVLFAERIEREDMRAGQIGDVNVVADAGSVRSFVVGAEDRDEFALALCDLQNQRDQMRFRMMRFALIGCRACSVEVTQARVTQAMNLV